MNTPTPEISIEEQAEAFKAWKRGEEVECRNAHDKTWVSVTNKSLYFYRDTIIRRKPQPKLRAWKPEEVPVGAVVRVKSSPEIRRLIIAYDAPHAPNYPVRVGHINERGGYNEQSLLNECEHSLDGGKTWLPCGVME